MGNPMLYFIIVIKMNINNKTISITFIVILAVTVAVSAIGMLFMSRQPMVLQGQIEATEIRISGKLPDNFDEESGFADRYARRCSGNGKPGRSMATSVLCEPGRIWEKLPLLHFLAAKVLHFDLKKADGLSGPGDHFLHQRLTGVVFHGKLS